MILDATIIDELLQTEQQIKEQLEGMSGSSVPLDMTEIVNVYTNVEFKETLDECKTEEERKRMQEYLADYYIKGPGKQFINSCVQKIQESFASVKSSMENMQDSLTNMVSSFAIPSVISVPPSSPNPAYILFDVVGKIKIISSIVDQANSAVISLYNSCLLVHLKIPEPIMAVTTSITKVKTSIDSVMQMIPV